MTRTTVTYNRSKATWELRGEILELLQSFPAGEDGRAQAQIRQLQLEVPAALKIALEIEDHAPYLLGRAIRAAQIIMNEKISRTEGRIYVHASQENRHAYTVTKLTHDTWPWHCSCPDWRDGESGASNGAPWVRYAGGHGPICKHIFAVLIADKIEQQSVSWPPTCPTCSLEMHIKRQQNNDSGLPFFSCSNFPNCRGRAEFQPHPDDLQAADGDGKEALYLSMERAQATGLVAVAIGAQMRARQRRMERERSLA